MFEAEAAKLEAATRAAVRSAARKLRTIAESEIRRNFKSKSNTSGSFGSVKVYDLQTHSKISLKPGYLEAFTEGKTIRGKTTLIILLPDGERLGFKRINRNNSWASVWEGIQKKARLAGVGDGVVVVYSYRGKNYAIYKFQKSTTAPKLISLKARAEALTETIPIEINQLLDSYEK